MPLELGIRANFRAHSIKEFVKCVDAFIENLGLGVNLPHLFLVFSSELSHQAPKVENSLRSLFVEPAGINRCVNIQLLTYRYLLIITPSVHKSLCFFLLIQGRV